MKVVVVGNGAIGAMTALRLSQENSTSQVTLVGPKSLHGSASAAAGAMAAVYGELEAGYTEQQDQNDAILRYGLDGRQLWRRLLFETGNEHVITAPDTYIYLQEQATEFETTNFNLVLTQALDDGAGEAVKPKSLSMYSPLVASRSQSALRLNGEFSFDPVGLFRVMDQLLKESSILVVDDTAAFVDSENRKVVTTHGDVLRFDFLVIAAGAQTGALIEDFGGLPTLQGVGSALLLEPSEELRSLTRIVLRTVNRGGAQCGFHLVPRVNGSLYVGAGNYVMQPGAASHRMETIRWLFTALEQEVTGQQAAYGLTGEFLIGNRPRSLDGLPMFGPLTQAADIFVSTAFNRLGFTWAPSLANEAAFYFRTGNTPDNSEQWKPDRSPRSFGTVSEGLDYFTESRLGSAVEHGLVGSAEDARARRLSELELIGRDLIRKVDEKYKLPPGEVIHPDSWTSIAHEPLEEPESNQQREPSE